MLAYPSPRAAALGLALVALASAGYFWPPAFTLAAVGALLLLLLLGVDVLLASRALSGRIELRRELPVNLTVLRPIPGRHVLASAARIHARVQIHEDSYPGLDKRWETGWQDLPAGGALALPLTVTAQRRGGWPLGGMGLRVVAGLGLHVLQLRFDSEARARVYPLIEELARGDLFAHRRRLHSLGQHSSRKFGRGTEFDRLREYAPDDEFRQINWMATARAGKPVVNQMQVEQSRDLILLMDCGRLMHTEIAGRSRLDHCLDAAVHLAYLALSQRDRVGLIAFDAEPRAIVSPARRPRQLDSLVNAMYDLQPRFVESDYGRAVALLRGRHHKRGLVVLFTDLLDSLSSRAAVVQLSRLARTHLPIVVILDDPEVARLAAAPAQRLEDVYVKGAAEKFISEKRAALARLRTRGCLIVNVEAERLGAAVVNEYLEVKARNLL